MMHWSFISEIIICQAIIYIALKRLFDIKFNKIIIFLPMLCIGLLSILELTNYYYPWYFITDIILYFVSPVLVIKGIKKSKIIFASLTILGIFSLVNVSTSFIVTFINPTEDISSFSNVVVNIVFLLITLLLLNEKHINFFQNFVSLSNNVRIIFIIFIWELFILISLLTILFSLYPGKAIISLVCFLIVFLMIISLLAFYLLLNNNLKNIYLKRINDTIKDNMDKQVTYYEKLISNYEDIRKFKHDINNIKIGLSALVTNKDLEGVIAYLNSLDSSINDSSILFNTGHRIIDAMLSDKLKISQENNIHIIFSGVIPSDTINPVDLCIIFGNLVDNSIEACQKIKNEFDKTISISANKKQDYMFITITNPVNENIKIKNNIIPSTKREKEMHGIGLYSVKQVLNKYHGHLKLNCKDSLFITEIDFQIQ